MTRCTPLLVAVGLVAALLVSCGTDEPMGFAQNTSVTLSIEKESAIEPDHYTITVQGDGVAIDTAGASGDTVWLQLNPGTYQFEIRAYDATDRLCGAASFSYEVTPGTHVIPVTLIAVPEITDEPNDVAVTDGESASFAVTAEGSDMEYQWQRDGADITDATDSVYAIAAVGTTDSGAVFRCIVTNTVGADTSRAALLEVLASVDPPQIQTEPQDQQVQAGDSARFVVAADGPGLSYQWQRDEVNIAGAEDTVYAFEVGVDDSGAVFRCIVRNSAGADTTRDALLQVSDTAQSGGAPVIETDPQPQSVAEGDTAEFAVSASGADLEHQWQCDGADIASATDSVYRFVVSAGDSGGAYRCIVHNTEGADTSAAALLHVSTGTIAEPVIQSDPQPVTALVGETATFRVSASGEGLTYLWQRDGSDLSTSDDSSYSFVVSLSDHGSAFRCIVSNSAGSDTSAEATLHVFEADSVIDTLRVTDVDTLTDIRPYRVTGAIIVEQGGVLVIEDGAYIKMGAAVQMTVSGELRCEGSASTGITFTAYDTTARWVGILLESATGAVLDGGGAYQSGCMLRYTTIEYADDWGLYLNSTSVFMDHCMIRRNGTGIHNRSDANSRIVDCVFIDNQYHGIAWGDSWGGTYELVLLRSTLARNGDRGIAVVQATKVLIDSCDVYENLGGGISLSRTTFAIIRNCTITDNRDEEWPHDGGGIQVQYGDTCVIRDNVVRHNMTYGCGGGICSDGGASGRRIVVGNLFVGNSAASGAGGCFTRPDSITYNTFYGNTPLPNEDSSAISFHHQLLVDDPETSFMHNNVVEREATYAVRNTNEEDGRVLNLRNNWWDTTIESEIADIIVDHSDDTTLQQTDYSGYLSAPVPEAPAIQVQ